MTIKEFIQKYGNLEFHFVSYYKYRFLYETISGGQKIQMWLGDDNSDIYRDSFNAVEKPCEMSIQAWSIDEEYMVK